jgi:hypothetical protein
MCKKALERFNKEISGKPLPKSEEKPPADKSREKPPAVTESEQQPHDEREPGAEG